MKQIDKIDEELIALGDEPAVMDADAFLQKCLDNRK